MKKPNGNQNRSTPLNNLKGTTNQIGPQPNTIYFKTRLKLS